MLSYTTLCCQEAKMSWVQEASPSCSLIVWWMSVCVAVGLCGSQMTQKKKKACVAARVHSFLCLTGTGLCWDVSKLSSCSTYCFVLSALITQTEGQNQSTAEDTVVAGVHVSVCSHFAWVEAARRRRCCREQKHFADVAGKEWMESFVVISCRALCDLRRYATCWTQPKLSLNEKATEGFWTELWVCYRWAERSGGRWSETGRKESLKNMFTSGGWGWRRSLRFPSWSVSQSGGGWDSLMVAPDVTRGTLISACLSLTFSLSLLTLIVLPSRLTAIPAPLPFVNITLLPLSTSHWGAFLHMPLSDLFAVCFSLSLGFNMAILERDIYWCSLSE